jgi:hypothetical protein
VNVNLSDMIDHYEKCRFLADYYRKVTILMDGQPDAVLLPITEYERLSAESEKPDHFSNSDIADLLNRLPAAGNREVYTLAQLKYDLNLGQTSFAGVE